MLIGSAKVEDYRAIERICLECAYLIDFVVEIISQPSHCLLVQS